MSNNQMFSKKNRETLDIILCKMKEDGVIPVNMTVEELSGDIHIATVLSSL